MIYIDWRESALCGIDESERESVWWMRIENENVTHCVWEQNERKKERMLCYDIMKGEISLKNLDRQAEWETTHRNSSPPLQRLQMIARECYHPKWEKMGLESKQNINFSKK